MTPHLQLQNEAFRLHGLIQEGEILESEGRAGAYACGEQLGVSKSDQRHIIESCLKGIRAGARQRIKGAIEE